MNPSTERVGRQYYEKLRQHRDSRHHPAPPLWPSVDLDLVEGSRLLPVVEQERAAHRNALPRHAAPPKRIPWDLLLVWSIVAAGVLYVAVSVLRAVL